MWESRVYVMLRCWGRGYGSDVVNTGTLLHTALCLKNRWKLEDLVGVSNYVNFNLRWEGNRKLVVTWWVQRDFLVKFELRRNAIAFLLFVCNFKLKGKSCCGSKKQNKKYFPWSLDCVTRLLHSIFWFCRLKYFLHKRRKFVKNCSISSISFCADLS